jgi:hypothetical protein
MTVLGKVLVYVNLAFSLLVAFFIIQAFSKRTEWAAAHKKASQEVQIANASRDQYIADAAKAKSESDAKTAAIQGAYEKAVKDLDAQKAVNTQLATENSRKEELLKTGGTTGAAVQAEIKRLTEANTRIEKMLADANKRLDDELKIREDFRQRAVKAEIDNKSLIARNNELLNVVEEKEKELIRQKAAPGAVTSAVASNPPPSDVEGRVKQYDPTSGLLTLTIGSDAGVLKGHTLYVYRLEPNGVYIGQVRILEVRPTEAVGKMVNKPRAPIQINDKVASKIS